MTCKIRVLHCIETIASGGVEQTILTLVRGLDKTKFQHRIVCTWKGGPVAEALEKEGVEITAVGSFKHPFELKKLRMVLAISREFRPQIIHGAVFEGMTMATFAGLFFKKAVVILEETSDPQNRSRKANLLLKAYSWRASAIQAISSNVGQYLEEITGIEHEKIKVIPNGVSIPESDLDEDSSSLEKLLSIQNCLIVGFVGRLYDDHKRVSDLIQTIKILGSKKVKLLIVGDGNDREKLAHLARDFGIVDQVIFVGYQSDTTQFYSLMDVLVIPSAREGFGLVAVEGMLHSLPVIASRVGGLQDIVLDGETGFLVPPLDPGAIASKIQLLIDNPQLSESMGAKGRTRALENYTADRYCGEVENLYLGLLNAGEGPGMGIRDQG